MDEKYRTHLKTLKVAELKTIARKLNKVAHIPVSMLKKAELIEAIISTGKLLGLKPVIPKEAVVKVAKVKVAKVKVAKVAKPKVAKVAKVKVATPTFPMGVSVQPPQNGVVGRQSDDEFKRFVEQRQRAFKLDPEMRTTDKG